MLGFTPIAAGPIASSGTQDYIFEVNSASYAVSTHGAAKLITEFVPNGAYILSGQSIDFTKAMSIDVGSGSFALTEGDAIFERRFGIVAR